MMSKIAIHVNEYPSEVSIHNNTKKLCTLKVLSDNHLIYSKQNAQFDTNHYLNLYERQMKLKNAIEKNDLERFLENYSKDDTTVLSLALSNASISIIQFLEKEGFYFNTESICFNYKNLLNHSDSDLYQFFVWLRTKNYVFDFIHLMNACIETENMSKFIFLSGFLKEEDFNVYKLVASFLIKAIKSKSLNVFEEVIKCFTFIRQCDNKQCVFGLSNELIINAILENQIKMIEMLIEYKCTYDLKEVLEYSLQNNNTDAFVKFYSLNEIKSDTILKANTSKFYKLFIQNGLLDFVKKYYSNQQSLITTDMFWAAIKYNHYECLLYLHDQNPSVASQMISDPFTLSTNACGLSVQILLFLQKINFSLYKAITSSDYSLWFNNIDLLFYFLQIPSFISDRGKIMIHLLGTCDINKLNRFHDYFTKNQDSSELLFWSSNQLEFKSMDNLKWFLSKRPAKYSNIQLRIPVKSSKLIISTNSVEVLEEICSTYNVRFSIEFVGCFDSFLDNQSNEKIMWCLRHCYETSISCKKASWDDQLLISLLKYDLFEAFIFVTETLDGHINYVDLIAVLIQIGSLYWIEYLIYKAKNVPKKNNISLKQWNEWKEMASLKGFTNIVHFLENETFY